MKTQNEQSFLKMFGANLKMARERLGLSQIEISEKLGLEKTSYYKYENGTRFPQAEILLDILNNFGISLDFLFSGKGEMFINETNNPLEAQNIFKDMPHDPRMDELLADLGEPVIYHYLMSQYLIIREDPKIKDAMNSYRGKYKFEEKKDARNRR